MSMREGRKPSCEVCGSTLWMAKAWVKDSVLISWAVMVGPSGTLMMLPSMPPPLTDAESSSDASSCTGNELSMAMPE